MQAVSTSLAPIAALLLTLVASACGKSEDRGSARPDTARNADSLRAAAAAESTAAELDQWNKAEVVKRLAEAGLVVSESGRVARHASLDIVGSVLSVSGGELQIFVYDDTSSRLADSRKLDTVYVESLDATAPPRPRFIVSNNLVAILTTSSSLLAERVENVLLARHLRARD
ncbi:MAG: hypothetical protein ABR543_04305 [Gemmatimonadaceae bacterium]